MVYCYAVRRADWGVGYRRRDIHCKIINYPHPLVRKDGTILAPYAANGGMRGEME